MNYNNNGSNGGGCAGIVSIAIAVFLGMALFAVLG